MKATGLLQHLDPIPLFLFSFSVYCLSKKKKNRYIAGLWRSTSQIGSILLLFYSSLGKAFQIIFIQSSNWGRPELNEHMTWNHLLIVLLQQGT
jgi:hypothetical protein